MTPTVQRFETRVEDKPWGKLVLVAETSEYTGKLLIRYGTEPYHRAGLQYHPDRAETAYLLSGSAWLYFVDGEGELRKVRLYQGDSVHIPVGAIHSFGTIGDSVVVETSVPGSQPAVRVEDDYDVTQAVEVQWEAGDVAESARASGYAVRGH